MFLCELHERIEEEGSPGATESGGLERAIDMAIANITGPGPELPPWAGSSPLCKNGRRLLGRQPIDGQQTAFDLGVQRTTRGLCGTGLTTLEDDGEQRLALFGDRRDRAVGVVPFVRLPGGQPQAVDRGVPFFGQLVLGPVVVVVLSVGQLPIDGTHRVLDEGMVDRGAQLSDHEQHEDQQFRDPNPASVGSEGALERVPHGIER